MHTKEQRHKIIQDIISKEAISTQTDLVRRLNDAGVQVTQATVSRDINELRLVRLPIGRGKHRYSLTQVSSTTDVLEELGRIFRSLVKDIDRAENLLVIRTHEGHANGIAFLLDKLHRDDIVGSIAGQDTIFIAARTVHDAELLIEELNGLLIS